MTKLWSIRNRNYAIGLYEGKTKDEALEGFTRDCASYRGATRFGTDLSVDQFVADDDWSAYPYIVAIRVHERETEPTRQNWLFGAHSLAGAVAIGERAMTDGALSYATAENSDHG